MKRKSTSAALGPIVLLALTVGLGGCAAGAGPLSEEVLRSKVVTGIGEDFREGTHAGPKGFGLCVRLGMRRVLDKPVLQRLLQISRRPDGTAYAARALSDLAVPVGDACGGRQFVPELTGAAAALRGARIVDSRAHRLGLEYGPYIGVSCHRASRISCDRIGFDLVLRRQARSVYAEVAGRPIRLVTPGPVPHDADAVGRDWGGYLEEVGLQREGSPFYIQPVSKTYGVWAGEPPVYLPVKIVVTYPGGRREALKIPPVFLSPGFGLGLLDDRVLAGRAPGRPRRARRGGGAGSGRASRAATRRACRRAA